MKKVIAVLAAATLAFSGTVSLAAEESPVTAIARWTGRNEIHSLLGAPHTVSGNGYKEIYKLSNGKIAVLKYIDNMLDEGYILVN